MNRRRPIHDPVHGAIVPSRLEWALIESAPVQRLRGIQQLGLVDLAYPGAMHTRFEHSVGTMHMAGRLSSHLGLDEGDLIRARLSGLLHDIGHSAYSHAVEAVLSRNVDLQPLLDGVPASGHEQFTAHILATHPFGEEALALVEGAFGPPDVFFREIAGIVQGRPPLGWIVSGDLDADRMDFLLRDSHHAGVGLGLVDVDQIIQALTLQGGRPVLAGDGDYRFDLSLTAAESMLIARAHHYNALVHHPRVQSGRAMLLLALESVLGGLDRSEARRLVAHFFTRYNDSDLQRLLLDRGDAKVHALLERLRDGRVYPLAARFDHRTLPPGLRMALATISRNGHMSRLFQTGLDKMYPALAQISIGSGVPRGTRTTEGFLYDESALAAGLVKALTRQLTLSFFGDEPLEVDLPSVEALAKRLLSFVREESYQPIEGLMLLFYSLHRQLSQSYGERILVPRIRNITWIYRTISRLKEIGVGDASGLSGLYDYSFHDEYGFPYSERLFEDIQILVAMGMIYQDLRHYHKAGRWSQRYEYMLTSEGLAHSEPIAEAYSEEAAAVERYLRIETHNIPYDVVSLLGRRYLN
ncbi:MAG: HD domain-containing protein [Methanotrichaceae archaeon]|nr:HD domain-containing protein [Methanotrichaceae archaeon]